MKKHKRRDLYGSLLLIAAFLLWTTALHFVDVQPIAPGGSRVGFAALNALFHGLTGVHMWLYIITDWLGLVPIIVAMGFALLGMIQWIRRRKLSKVDHSLFILGGFYLCVMAFYLVFEAFPVNYRPILINGNLEASYPSSTTLLVMCVMPTTLMQLNSRIKTVALKKWIAFFLVSFTVFMVVARLLSGVHWLTDILGGMLLSGALVMMYRYLV